MAVPFNLPVEEDNIDEIIRQLQVLLIRLSEHRMRTQSSSTLSRLNRVRRHHHHHHRIDDDANISHSDLPDVIVCSRIPTTAGPTSTSKSCYKDTKTQQDNDDCIEVGVVLRHTTSTTTTSKNANRHNNNDGSPERGKDVPGDRLWRIVPECLKGSLWTAVPVICVVGWHLFQTTY